MNFSILNNIFDLGILRYYIFLLSSIKLFSFFYGIRGKITLNFELYKFIQYGINIYFYYN